MLSVATDNPDYPLVFVTFDRVTSDDASYRKSALIHVQEEPTVTKDGFVIIANTKGNNNGKLVVQNLLEEVEYTLIGGEGKEFWLSDTLGNADVDTSGVAGSLAEYGWGRLEISPKKADLTDHILTVMYVTDGDNEAAPIKAVDISSDKLAGSMLLGKAMLFPKNEKLLDAQADFTIKNSAECFVVGVSAGAWTIMNGDKVIDTVMVEEGVNLITFTAEAGKYTVKPAN